MFLDRYVTPAGRVVRRDQGGDTVSEGQGYGLLLAYAVGDRRRFDAIWMWTRTHLQGSDGLFAYRWSAGQVNSEQPAADADTQIAWALDLAAQRWSVPADRTAARTIAEAVANEEIGYDDQGRPTLAAGPWAIAPGRPVTVEPGYWTFPADIALGRLTGDRRWQALATSDAAHLASLTGNGTALPADWAVLGGGSAPSPTSAPGGGASAQSGQDGLRSLVWAACDSTLHLLDAKWWGLLASTAGAGPLARSLSGQPVDGDVSPLSLVASAAAAGSAGRSATERNLLATADTAARRYPTYYGDAWTALARVLLTTSRIPGCAPPSASS
jgi:endoglucanase